MLHKSELFSTDCQGRSISIFHSLRQLCIKSVQNNKMSLIPGNLAPDFTLLDLSDDDEEKVESISLNTMKGKFVVLMFFPVDLGTSPLTSSMPWPWNLFLKSSLSWIAACWPSRRDRTHRPSR